jgi:TolB-like protein
MKKHSDIASKERPSISRWPWGFLFILIISQCVAAQNLKNVSSSLAAHISSSGRKTVAVMDFTDLQGSVTELGRFLAEELSVDLLDDSKGFEVIDRTHLKALMQEYKLSTTGLIDPQTARKLGQIAGVDALVTGTITPLGDSVRLSAKVLDTVTAKMLAASTADIPRTKAIEDLLGRGIGVSQSGGRESTSPTPSAVAGNSISVEDNALLFVLQTCRRSGRTVTCAGSITNKAERRREIILGYHSNAVDELGNQYAVPDEQLRLGSGGTRQDLEPDLPVNFSASVNEVDPAATRISIVLGYGASGPGPAVPRVDFVKAVFRRAPIR